MAYHNELTEIALNELKAHGIKGHLRDTNGGHIEITWQVVPEKQVRTIIVAKTTSDWRSRMNTRADVRRLLRADNVTLKMQHEKKPQKVQQFDKALALPQPETLSVPDQLKALRAEVGDLTALVLRLTKISATVRDTVAVHVPRPEAIVPPPPSSRSVKLVEYLSEDRWVTIDTLPRDTGLKPEQIKLKLQYLKQHDLVEVYRGQVRLKPPKPKPEKKIHWKTAQKAARVAAEEAAAKKDAAPRRRGRPPLVRSASQAA
ncbi:hypothetical protein [Bradyrhizobium arachidis]|uniref:Uncharacterized protein n=1 Tax=Bradyrhizobium arachidis TaxID=858423 RepID=A0AAE7THV8_9BRAD|nr:hypothetical protein [Bradyrhizobium arachidis]QOZ68905.1 hypothetical protein WN72_23180 [Bradyrhizobium arachidis]SFV19449.1 hypothetical protein SAMN05192541_15130 [Bradyrhizobium arachidis]